MSVELSSVQPLSVVSDCTAILLYVKKLKKTFLSLINILRLQREKKLLRTHYSTAENYLLIVTISTTAIFSYYLGLLYYSCYSLRRPK